MNIETTTTDELETKKEEYRSELNKLYSEMSNNERKEFTERYNYLRSTLASYRQIIHQKRRIESSQTKLSRFTNTNTLVIGLFLYAILYQIIFFSTESKNLLELTIGIGVIGLIGYFILFLINLNLNTSEEIIRLKEELFARDLKSYQIERIFEEDKQIELFRTENFRTLSSVDYYKLNAQQEILDFKLQLFLIDFVKGDKFPYHRLF